MLYSTPTKIAYTIFKDCMSISLYQQNSQLTCTNSKLTVDQEAKYVQKTPERHQFTVCSCQLMLCCDIVFNSVDVVMVCFFC